MVIFLVLLAITIFSMIYAGKVSENFTEKMMKIDDQRRQPMPFEIVELAHLASAVECGRLGFVVFLVASILAFIRWIGWA